MCRHSDCPLSPLDTSSFVTAWIPMRALQACFSCTSWGIPSGNIPRWCISLVSLSMELSMSSKRPVLPQICLHGLQTDAARPACRAAPTQAWSLPRAPTETLLRTSTAPLAAVTSAPVATRLPL